MVADVIARSKISPACRRGPAQSLHWPPGAAAVEALTPFGCRWPIGEVADEDFSFCGAVRLRGAYCATHRRLAYGGDAR